MPDAPDIRPDAQRLVQQLPASATWDDLAYEIYVRQAIEQGVADADSGRTVDHDTAMARVRARVRRASLCSRSAGRSALSRISNRSSTTSA
jgi:predicted transcriptional regulator